MKHSTLYFWFGIFIVIVLYIMEMFTGAIYYYYLSVLALILTMIVFHKVSLKEDDAEDKSKAKGREQ